MALNAYAELTANGTALSGEVTQQEIGGVDVASDHLEIYEFEFGSAQAEADGRRSRGCREIEPLVMTTRLDRATPLLYRALTENQRIDGDLKIFDTNPEDGSTRHHFTIRIDRGVIQAVETVGPDVLDPEQSSRPVLTRFAVVPHTISYVDEVHATEYQDSQ